ncbi:MAG: glucokinase [Alphaproteobacteria bacterium RIFCSPHIGHO2_12_FULL_66_14]|nr:MAG: glucokinase [Alphaproteobacteria bacterium RIFCSPHIGHO2_12_FULL_66_14]
MRRVLLADIGGTYARFAVQRGDNLGPVRSLDVRAHATMADALRFFLAGRDDGATIDVAILAVAGPVEGGRCVLTNSSWIADAPALGKEFGIPSVRIVNDQEAAAWGLPNFAPSDTRLIGPETPVIGAPMVLLSPGTGLGVACLVPGASGARVIASEGGHATLAATTAHEEALIGALRRQFGHASAERALSGDGLVNLYRATAMIDGVDIVSRTAAEITQAALDGTCTTCRKTLDAFCGLLGSVAGNIALLFGARGGVFIGGGIVPRIVEHLGRTEFRERFEAKGRLGHYLAKIPVRVVLRPDPAFLGLAVLTGADGRQSDV